MFNKKQKIKRFVTNRSTIKSTIQLPPLKDREEIVVIFEEIANQLSAKIVRENVNKESFNTSECITKQPRDVLIESLPTLDMETIEVDKSAENELIFAVFTSHDQY